MFNFLKRIYKNLISEKEVIIVSQNSIKRNKISPFRKIINFIFCVWVIFSTCFAFFSFSIVENKNKKIIELKNVNYNLSENISNLNILTNNLKNYLSTLNYYDRFDKIDIKKISDDKHIMENKELLSSIEYKNILPVINSLDRDINNLEESLDSRINGINNVLSKAPVLKNKADQIYNVNYKNITDNESLNSTENIFSSTSVLVKKNEVMNIREKIQYLSFLETFLNSIPMRKPMNNYFLTSRYGSRIDPFTGEVKTHKGLDFAGSYNTDVKATADATVEFSGIRGGFGNVITLNHGNEIRTTYAHLKKSFVKKGEKISKNVIIGQQGNSGRSTGQHLHYEISVDKKNTDPIKLINIGETVY